MRLTLWTDYAFRTLIYVVMVVIGVLIAVWVFVALLDAAGLHVNLFRLGSLSHSLFLG